MTDLDLAELRRIAEAALDDWGSPVPTLGLRAFHEATYPPAVLALLDRIESLEAERDTYRQDSFTGQAMHAQWQERADRAEARLARVTDDSMQATLQLALHRRFCDAPDDVCAEDGGKGGEWWHECGVALATIRAVAADSETVVNRDDDGKVVAADEQEAPDA